MYAPVVRENNNDGDGPWFWPDSDNLFSSNRGNPYLSARTNDWRDAVCSPANFSSVNSVATNRPRQAALPPLVSSQPPRENDYYLETFNFRVCSILDSLLSARIAASFRQVGFAVFFWNVD